MDQIKHLTDNQIKLLEIDNLEDEIKVLRDRVNLIKKTINHKPNRIKNRIWLSDILEAVCQYTEFTPDEIINQHRYKNLVKARSLYVNLSLELTNNSSFVIAKHLGNRDHTTIIYHKKLKKNKMKYWNDSKDEGATLWRDYHKIQNRLILEKNR